MTEAKFGSEDTSRQIEAEVGMFQAISSGEKLTQRGLSAQIGIALGLTNSLLKRAAKKGLVKIQQAPAKRYAYYLTPKGFQEKCRLVAEYLSVSLNFYRRAREEYAEAFDRCHAREYRRVVLVGTGDLAEIAVLSAQISGIEIIGVIDESRNTDTFCGLKVFRSLKDLPEVDAFFITDSVSPQIKFDNLAIETEQDQIFTPNLLHVTRDSGSGDGGGQ